MHIEEVASEDPDGVFGKGQKQPAESSQTRTRFLPGRVLRAPRPERGCPPPSVTPDGSFVSAALSALVLLESVALLPGPRLLGLGRGVHVILSLPLEQPRGGSQPLAWVVNRVLFTPRSERDTQKTANQQLVFRSDFVRKSLPLYVTCLRLLNCFQTESKRVG